MILMAWSAQEVRAETATNIESQIRLSQWLNMSANSARQLKASTEDKLFTAYLPGLVWMVPEEAQEQSLMKSQYWEYIHAENSTPEVARVDGMMLASSVKSQPVTTHDSVFKAVRKDLTELSHRTTTQEFWRSVLAFGGISLASSIADKPLDKFAVNHGKNGIMTSVEKVGNNLPFVAIGYSAMMFLTSDEDSKLAKSSYSSLAAGGVGALSALGLKYMVGRARPAAEHGSASFTPISASNGNTSWPSMHTTVMWAVITPYAKAYDAPWLYGVAAVTNIARIGGRDHWFSDTVAGSLLGYAIGNFMWESHQTEKGRAEWIISPNKIAVNWNF
jgi:membrane-associated phospholipid phosphatase